MKLLTIADMVDNLAEKVDECPLLGVIEYSYIHLGPRKLSIMQRGGVRLVRGCLSIVVIGRTVGSFRIVHYIMGARFSGVSIKRGSTVVRKCFFLRYTCMMYNITTK